MKERKWISGEENKYMVSSWGDVVSFTSGVPRAIVLIRQSTGYNTVNINSNACLVHRLVAQEFLGDGNGLIINHKNGIKHDNRIENLERCTFSENNAHAYRVLGRKPTCPQKGKYGKESKRSKMISMFSLTGELIRKFHGGMEAEREMNINQQNIHKVCRGERKKAGGYLRQYDDLLD